MAGVSGKGAGHVGQVERQQMQLLRPDAETHLGADIQGMGGGDHPVTARELVLGFSAVAFHKPGVEQVRHAQEAGHELRRRVLVQVSRVAQLLDVAGAHHRDPIGHGHRLVLVVGDVDEGDAYLRLDALELELHLFAQLEIECAQWLVEQQHARVIDQGASESDALLLAARQHARLASLVAGQLDQGKHVADFPADLRSRHLAPAQAECDVLEHFKMGKEGVVLEDGVDVALVGRTIGHVRVAEVNRARAGRLEAGDHAQGGRFATARWAQHGEELAVLDVEHQVIDRHDLVEALGYVIKPNVGLHRGPS